jgi:hypothetical protein
MFLLVTLFAGNRGVVEFRRGNKNNLLDVLSVTMEFQKRPILWPLD